jgi:hypothetical protein
MFPFSTWMTVFSVTRMLCSCVTLGFCNRAVSRRSLCTVVYQLNIFILFYFNNIHWNCTTNNNNKERIFFWTLHNFLYSIVAERKSYIECFLAIIYWQFFLNIVSALNKTLWVILNSR